MIDLSKEAEEYATIPSTLSLTTRQKIQIAYSANLKINLKKIKINLFLKIFRFNFVPTN